MKQLFKKFKGLFGAYPKDSYTVEILGATYVVSILSWQRTPRYVYTTGEVMFTGYTYALEGIVDGYTGYTGSISSSSTTTPSNDELVAFVKKVYPAKELIKNGKEGLIAKASSLPPPTKDIVLAMFSSLGSGRFSFSKHKDTKRNWNTLILEDKLLRLHYCLDLLQTDSYNNYSGEKSTPTLKITFSWEKTGTISLTKEEVDYIECLVEWFEFYTFELRGLQAKRKERKEQRASNTLRKQLTNLYRAEGSTVKD